MTKQLYTTKAAVISGLMLFIYLGIYCFFLSGVSNFDNVQITSILGLIVLGFILISWHRKYHRILSPYIVFSATLYLTLCGQTIPWAFGSRAGYRDLTLAAYNGLQFSDSSICKALLFSYLCLLTTHVIVINKVDCRSRMLTHHSEESDYVDD